MATFTVGKTTDGASFSSSSADKIAVSSATASGAGTLTAGSTRAWLTAAGSSAAKMVVYADSSGAPGSLLAVSDQVTITQTADAEISFTFSGANQIAITNGAAYWVGLFWQDPDPSGSAISLNLSRDATASGRLEILPTYPNAPNPFGTGTAQTGPIASYLIVTSSGGGGSTLAIRASSTGSSGTTSMTAAKPAGLTAGDYLLAWHCGDADTTALTASGFASLATQAATSSTNIPYATLWGKVASSSDVSAATFAFGCTSSATPSQTVLLMAITAGTYDTTTPVTAGTWTTQTRGNVGSGVATQTINSMTGVANGLLLGLISTDANGNTQTYPSTASTMTLISYVQASGGYSLLVGYQQALTAGGATGSTSVTPSGTNTSNGWATIPVLINPGAVVYDPTLFFFGNQ